MRHLERIFVIRYLFNCLTDSLVVFENIYNVKMMSIKHDGHKHYVYIYEYK